MNIFTNEVEVWTFIDSSINISSARDYGQKGIIIGLHANNDPP